jgi:hypothetical protein
VKERKIWPGQACISNKKNNKLNRRYYDIIYRRSQKYHLGENFDPIGPVVNQEMIKM